MKPGIVRGAHWRTYNGLFLLQHFLGYRRFYKFFGARKDKLDREIAASLVDVAPPPQRAVRVLDGNATFEEFSRYCDQPLVFRGAALDWTCCREWSLDFFREKYGSTEVMLNDNVGLVDADHPQQFSRIKLRDYIDSVKQGSRSYLKFARDIFEDNPPLKQDLNLEWLRARRLRSSFREEILMFMSAAGTLTPTHAGVSGNLFIQVMGQKTWTLWEPGDRIFIDGRTERTFYYFSSVDPRRPNDSGLPLAKYATCSQVTLEPGDVLWVPPFFWHHVYNPTPSIGVTYRVMSFPAAFRGSTLLMTLIFFATRPNPFYHLYMSTFHKKTAIFQKKFDDL